MTAAATTTVTIVSNPVHAKLHEAEREVKLLVQSWLSYNVAGAENTLAFKRTGWDGRSSFLDFRTGTFPAGFVAFVTAKLMRAGYKVNSVRKPAPPPLGPERPKVDNLGEDPRYDYQPEVIDRLVKHRQIIAQVATGGGKSRIARMAYARINRPTLFITTRGILMYQMADAFKRDMGIDCSILGDGQFGHTDANGRQVVKKISLGMVQTLTSRLEEKTVDSEVDRVTTALINREAKAVAALTKKLAAQRQSKVEIDRQVKALSKKQEKERPHAKVILEKAKAAVGLHMHERARTIALLEKFELVILEEAHEVSGSSYYDILKFCKNAHYRLALTATPFMKDDEEANMRLMAVSGPIGIRITEKMLIDRGILAKPYFKFVPLRNKPNKLNRGTAWQAAYRLGIVECEERNALIVGEAERAARYGLPVMILVQQTKHGDTLEAMLAAKGIRVAFIRGENDQDERQTALNALGRGEVQVLIGTTILDVGVDVPAVGLVILAGGGKAEVALRQRIGRGARAKKVGSNVFFVVDFTDEWNSHTRGHAQQRQEIIKGTPGFDEGILPANEDFNYEKFGFSATPLAKAAA